MNKKWKVILSVILLITTICTVFSLLVIQQHDEKVAEIIKGKTESATILAESLLDELSSRYQERIKAFTNPDFSPDRNRMIRAFANRDRETLLQLSTPFIKLFKRENIYFSSLTWVLPSNCVFLRLHAPDKYGDSISDVRPDIEAVHQKHTQHSGFEGGEHGFEYRVVQPVFYEGKYIGAVQFGISAASIMDALYQKFESVAGMVVRNNEYDLVKRGDIPVLRGDAFTLCSYNAPMFTPVFDRIQWDGAQQNLLLKEKKHSLLSVLPANDYKGTQLGHFFLTLDTSNELEQRKKLIYTVIIISCILLLFSFVILYFSYGSLVEKILTLNNSLEQNNIELEKSVDQRTAELQISKKQLETIFDSSPAAIFIHDMDGNILDVNQTMLTMYKVDKEEALQFTVAKDYSSADNQLDKLPKYWEEVQKGGSVQFEWIAKRPHDESTFVVQVDLEKISYGGKDAVYATVLDITEQREAEKKLAAEQEWLAVTLRSIGDGVIATDTEGRIGFINKVAEELTGWSAEEARGQYSPVVFNIINEKTGVKCISPVQRVLDTGRIVGLANHTALVAKDGTIRSIADSGAPIRDFTSKVVGVVLVFRDVTRERKMEEELLRIEKLESIGVLAGGIAHDFNNILAVILGNIELVEYRVNHEDTKAVSLLSDAKKATKRATKLTHQLLTFSKGGEPIKGVTSIQQLLQDSAEFVLHGSQIGCRFEFPEDLWDVEIDTGQISQVVQNIILNAKHSMPEGGTIQIRCANIEDAGLESRLSIDFGHYVQISVQDNGIGIPKSVLDKIFDPYFSTKQHGHGLGLAICHSIINKHEGFITVDSEPGKGTVFRIYLPAVLDADRPVALPSFDNAAIKACRIIVMDDEKMIRDVAKEQLEALGHDPITVSDGQEALDKYQELQDRESKADLVIMDLTIPGGMGGREAAEKLLEIDPEAKLIVASGYSNDPILADYSSYGFCASVAKPFDLKELSAAIAKAIN